MIRSVQPRLFGLCMGRAAVVRVCVRVRSPPTPRQFRQSYSPIKAHAKNEFSGTGNEPAGAADLNGDVSNRESEGVNRVMVVIDSSPEAKIALQWALSHSVQSQDTIILLYVTNPSKQGANSSSEVNHKAYGLLCSMKNMCQMRRPGVHVEIALREGKEKGTVIVEESKKENVSLLVLGQGKRPMMWCMRKIWEGKVIHRKRVLDHCIQNADCMTIAVRRKSGKHGGYLITTKRHKNFWLLA